MTLYEEIYKLKNLVRTGWLVKFGGGKRLESDAEHTFSMIIYALELMSKCNLSLDQLKVVKMIAYHELCEIDAEDFTPFDKISKEQKYNLEYDCIKRLARDYDMPEIEQLWLEFEESKTPEAKFVKDIDNYDAVLQAKIYSEIFDRPDVYKEFSKTHFECVNRMKEFENIIKKKD